LCFFSCVWLEVLFLFAFGGFTAGVWRLNIDVYGGCVSWVWLAWLWGGID
jgi:hypothetical protein